jgi:hypothetical protein
MSFVNSAAVVQRVRVCLEPEDTLAPDNAGAYSSLVLTKDEILAHAVYSRVVEFDVQTDADPQLEISGSNLYQWNARDFYTYTPALEGAAGGDNITIAAKDPATLNTMRQCRYLYLKGGSSFTLFHQPGEPLTDLNITSEVVGSSLRYDSFVAEVTDLEARILDSFGNPAQIDVQAGSTWSDFVGRVVYVANPLPSSLQWHWVRRAQSAKCFKNVFLAMLDYAEARWALLHPGGGSTVYDKFSADMPSVPATREGWRQLADPTTWLSSSGPMASMSAADKTKFCRVLSTSFENMFGESIPSADLNNLIQAYCGSD